MPEKTPLEVRLMQKHMVWAQVALLLGWFWGFVLLAALDRISPWWLALPMAFALGAQIFWNDAKEDDDGQA